MQLNDLLVQEKTIEQPFPGCDGFVVTLAFLSKESMNSLRKKSTTRTINRSTRQPEETLDEELFTKNFIKSVVKGWTGLKFRYLDELVPVDLSNLEDVDAMLEYTEEQAEILMKNSVTFDQWVGGLVNDLQNFTTLK